MDDDTRQALREVWNALDALYRLHLTPTEEYPPDPGAATMLKQLARRLRRLQYVTNFGKRGVESQDG